MPDIFLWAGEPNPDDIRLHDPTVSGAELHSGNVVATGGGVIVLNLSTKGASVLLSLTGGGILTTVAQKDAAAAVVVSGGGVLTAQMQKDGSVSIASTGGGLLTIDAGQNIIKVMIPSGAGPAKRRRAQAYDGWTLEDDDAAVLELVAMAG